MYQIKRKMGLVAVIILSLFPIVPWLFMKPLELRFGSFVTTTTSVGQLSALVGIVMFSLALLLIARLRILEPYFDGLDRMIKTHRYLGAIGFLLILIHPLALSFRLIPVSVSSAATFFLPTLTDMPKTLGIIALLLMMALLSVTMFAKVRYQILINTHRFLGVAFMLGALHSFQIPSDLSTSGILTVYIGFFVALGTIAYLYRVVFRVFIPKYYYVVQKVAALDHSVTEITMTPAGKHMLFKSGQFIYISFKNGNVSREAHPFSISSAPDAATLRITVKTLGDYTSTLPSLAVGATAVIEGPFGGFTGEHAKHDSEIWIAGGIGITPFLSRARQMQYSNAHPKPTDFYYTANTREEMLFLRELQNISRLHPSFRVIPYASNELGFLTPSAIQKHSGALHDKDIFMCGPPPMMKSLTVQCKELGVTSSQLHSEVFSML